MSPVPRVSKGSGRTLVGLLATSALALSAAAAVSPSASSAPAAAAAVEDCTATFPAAEVTAGQAVTGLTVARGTTPADFDGEILGVVSDGIAPGVDMIMARLSSPEIDRVGGIWAGMSGSPVYAADGRLIGAVAYGLSFGPSTVAGITPFEEMQRYFPVAQPANRRVAVSDRVARVIASGSSATVAEARDGFSRLRIPMAVSGVGAARLAQIAADDRSRRWLRKNLRASGSAGGAAGAAPGVEAIMAGGNLGAAASTGDITFGGVGTVTSVCRDRVIGFGHPMYFLGRSTAMLTPAEALFVQEDPTLVPFKVANLADPVGTITDDRTTGISGPLGVLPEATRITSTVEFTDRDGIFAERTGFTDVSVPLALPSAAFYQLLANHDVVVDGQTGGSELQTWTIDGLRESGEPWRLSFQNRYADSEDITFEAAWDLADAVYLLERLEGVTIDSASVTSEVTEDPSVFRLGAVQQWRNGAWRTVTRTNPAVGQRGQQLTLRVAMRGGTENSFATVSRTVPRRASGRGNRVYLWGGESTFSWASGNSLDKVLSSYRNRVRNDEVQAMFEFDGRRFHAHQNDASDPKAKVVRGVKRVPVRIG